MINIIDRHKTKNKRKVCNKKKPLYDNVKNNKPFSDTNMTETAITLGQRERGSSTKAPDFKWHMYHVALFRVFVNT